MCRLAHNGVRGSVPLLSLSLLFLCTPIESFGGRPFGPFQSIFNRHWPTNITAKNIFSSTLRSVRLTADKVKASVETGLSSDGPASRLRGSWNKIEEVGQDQAMLQLGLNVIFRKAAKLLG